MADQVLNCRTCGKEFTFSQREQEFYAAKQFAEPRHCQECRAQRKREKSEGVEGMEVVVVRPIRQERSRSWTEVECATCGKPAHVPFRPTGDKPVYCKDCFTLAKNSQETPVHGFSPRSAPARSAPMSAQPPISTRPVMNQFHMEIEVDPPTNEAVHPNDWIDDPGPLPDTDPAPDEEGEITTVDYIPTPISFGSTPEEVNPSFDDADSGKPAK